MEDWLRWLLIGMILALILPIALELILEMWGFYKWLQMQPRDENGEIILEEEQ